MDPHTGYNLWASTYDADETGNPVLGAERAAMRDLLPPLRGRAVLDLACGTGHYALQAAQAGARRVVGADLSMGMLHQARDKVGHCWPLVLLVQADQACLPFGTRTFDVVIHAVGMGYAPDLRPVTAELARVLRPGGVAFVSDLHPQGVRQGWRRTFVHRAGAVRRQVDLRTYAHRLQDYHAAFEQAGLSIIRIIEPQIDETTRPFFAAAGALERYERYWGHPLLVIFELRRVGRIGNSSHGQFPEGPNAD
ncbi:MAG: class I SAM-dependent methyltransferase [Anaerolineae bacterium]